MNPEQTNERVGAVMIVGGGIGGIQSALDLAESGFYVYLVEKLSCIGGRMAQLDKTFPTNDCSMCIMGPKLVECGRHLNIEILTLSEVESVSGNEGNFKVKIHQHARYIDPDKCTGCGDCANACPVSIPDEFNMGLGLRKATYLSYPQGVPRVNAIVKKDRAPCVNTCPAGINVQGYVQLIGAGKYREAIQLIRERLPLPGVLGRVCPHPCEFQCRRADVDEAIAIRDLKRFAADQVNLDELPLPEIEDRSEKVAIVGSGPAGLSVAYYLRLKGYQVTIFEALPVLGGMLRVGIPDYRLPPELLDAEINHILRLGIETQTGKCLGMDFTLDDLKRDGFNAIFLAIGAHLGMKSNVKGEDEFEGVVNAVDFLRDVNLGSRERPGSRVVIIGGGNVAIDAARVARRLGCEEVALAYRRSEKEIPAFSEEIEGALAEGVKFHYLTAPVRVLGEGGRVIGLECVRTELGPPDASGRRRPVPVEGSEFVIDCDGVIPAIGQQIDIGWAKDGDALDVTRRSTLVVNQHTMQTSIPHVFAGGDAVTGPATVIEAVAAGHKAVEAIHLYINGEDLDKYAEQLAVQEPLGQDWAEIPKGLATEPRAHSKHLEPQERITSFDEVDLCFTEEEAQREAHRCLNCGVCCECFQCVEACKAEAIDHNMADSFVDIDVGSIILAPGFNPYDPRVYDTYRYSQFPNVVTSLEFERLLSASGPYGGHLIRLSDEKEPKKIAWIQCVGSRNTQIGAKGYCSGVCCTYAIKQAMIAKEHSHIPLDTAIFYIDVRTHGKDFERYFNRAKEETGIRFIKSRISNVLPGDEPGELKIRYTDEAGATIREDFDIVVLSIGLDIAQGTVDLAKKIGVELDHYNFVDTSSFEPVKTSRQGIYVCGAFEAPKDIPETVAQASAAAASATSALSDVRGTRIKIKEYPPERDVSKEAIKIGVFICHCGINIGGVANVPEIVEYTKTLPYVDYVEDNLFTCAEDTQVKMQQVIIERQLTRVVVASCTPRTHEALFRETCREGGLNPYLFEMANIRDQCTWVHMHEPDRATAKCKDLVRMAVARAARLEQLYQIPQSISQDALVVGGGVAGMTAALGLADQGFKTYLIEREESLGGQALSLHTTWKGESIQAYVEEIVKRVNEHPLLEVHLQTKIKQVNGIIGNFSSKLVDFQGKETEVSHGAVIIANGAESYKPEEYLYGEDPNVLLSLDLDQEIMQNADRLKQVNTAVFIQCVGSREPDRPYCSRVCCTHSIHSALTLKKLNPDMDIYIICRDIRTYGEREDLYREARSKGVNFIRYEVDDKPRVENTNGKLRVTVTDQAINMPVEIDADIITLASAIVPRDDNVVLSKLFKLAMNQDGFFMEAHAKLRPVDFACAGVFLCGLAHGPKSIDEAISQAKATVSRACTILSNKERMVGGVVAVVDPERCAICLTCVRVCPFGVPEIDYESGVAKIDPGACQGCGSCAAACPRSAIQVLHYKDDQQIAKLMAIF